MFSDYDHGADAYCVRCGASIWFNVGMGSSICNSCGGDWEKTDEQLEIEKLNNIRYEKELEARDSFTDDTIKYLYNKYKTSKDKKEKNIIAFTMECVDPFHSLTQRVKGF